jgi:hypothetical protein
MSTSILDDIKLSLNRLPDDESFDVPIMMFINGIFADLNQLGVGEISGRQNKWDEFYTDPRLNAVKTYVFYKCKLHFDPPEIGAVMNAYNEQLAELEFRLQTLVDYG